MQPDQALRQALSKHPHVRMAILFGSLASGWARPDSDVDLAVWSDGPLDAETRIALIDDVALALGRPVDIIDLTRTGEPLLGQILRNGRRLLGSDIDYASLLSRHVFNNADFVPYVNRMLEERRRAWIG